MKSQADKNNEDLKNHVKEKIDELTVKVEQAKIDALEKEIKDKEKMDSVCDRLKKIEENMRKEKDKGEERARLAEEQRVRTRTFKEAVGMDATEEPTEKTKATIVE